MVWPQECTISVSVGHSSKQFQYNLVCIMIGLCGEIKYGHYFSVVSSVEKWSPFPLPLKPGLFVSCFDL